MKQIIGKRARTIRLEKGIKQAYVAQRLGFKSSSSLNDIEKGRRNLSVEKVPLLADILGVSIDELFLENEFAIRERLKGDNNCPLKKSSVRSFVRRTKSTFNR